MPPIKYLVIWVPKDRVFYSTRLVCWGEVDIGGIDKHPFLFPLDFPSSMSFSFPLLSLTFCPQNKIKGCIQPFHSRTARDLEYLPKETRGLPTDPWNFSIPGNTNPVGYIHVG